VLASARLQSQWWTPPRSSPMSSLRCWGLPPAISAIVLPSAPLLAGSKPRPVASSSADVLALPLTSRQKRYSGLQLATRIALSQRCSTSIRQQYRGCTEIRDANSAVACCSRDT